MKFNKFFIAAAAAALVAVVPAAAEGLPENLTFNVNVQTAYYPASDMITNTNEAHFAKITGAYSGAEACVIGNMNYKIPTPLGEHWLLKDANINLGASLQLTPITVKPGIKAEFTPLPFLVFSAGAELGTGWSISGMGMHGLSIRNSAGDFVSKPFTAYFYKGWAQGTFQFDTGALIPGDWSHVVMMYSYQVYYEGVTGAANQQLWIWQTSQKVNGLRNYQCGILAYQMPLALYRVGVMYEYDGFYKSSVYANPYYNGAFKEMNISPLLQFNFDDHNELVVLFNFGSRRSYYTPVDEKIDSNNSYASREWYFKRIALSYTYKF